MSDEVKTRKAKAAKTEEKSGRETYKYGVKDIAEKLDTSPEVVRGKLRTNGVEKAEGGVYGWDTQREVDEVVKAISSKAEPKAEKKAPAKKEAVPAKAEKKTPARASRKEKIAA